LVLRLEQQQVQQAVLRLERVVRPVAQAAVQVHVVHRRVQVHVVVRQRVRLQVLREMAPVVEMATMKVV
jgi:hypothetical protein